MNTRLDASVRDAVLQVRQKVGVARLDDYVVLEISGQDAPAFLQNRLSNDVLALAPGQGQMNAVLDRQGKIEGVFSLHRKPDGFFALVEQAALESTCKGLLKFKIIEQVDLTDHSETITVLSCQGPMAKAMILNATAHPEHVTSLADYGFADTTLFGMPARLVRRSLSGEDGFLMLVAPEHAEIVWCCLKEEAQSAGGLEMSPEVREVLRIEAGLPLFGRDYNTGTLLPETGLEREAVSYSKGCYLGQETIARIKTYGTVQRALAGLLFEVNASIPPIGSECRLAGQPVGVIQSGADSPTLGCPIAMAYLGKTERVPGKSLGLEINGHVYHVTVKLLPFYDARMRHQSGPELLAEGLKLFSDGFDEEATRVLRQAIEAEPTLVDAYEALGVILSRQDRYDDAIALMEQVLALDPDHVLAHTNLSVFYMKKGDKEKAEDEKAKATMAAFSRKMRESGQVYDIEAERHKKEQAAEDRIGMFREALKFAPEDPLGNFGLGSAYLELKRYPEAVEPFERVVKAQPKHSVAWLSLGKALEGMGDLSRARETYERGIEVAAAKGDLMPLREMQARLDQLSP
jgi:folate-binding protein YgfZ